MPALDKTGGALTTPTTVKWRFPSTHPEGRKFAAGSAALTLFAFLLGWEIARLAAGRPDHLGRRLLPRSDPDDAARRQV